jgi:hypothetical protein
MTLTWQQFTLTVLAGIPWYIYLLAGIGIILVAKDIYSYGRRKIMFNLRKKGRTEQTETSGLV